MKPSKTILATVLAFCCIVGIAHANILGFGTGTLRVGSSGEYVANLQTVLNNFEQDSLIIDGRFGQNTKFAVQAFQSTAGLVPDGAVGNLTKQALIAVQSGSQITITTPSIQSISPSTGPMGTVVTLFGYRLSSVNTVLFGGGPVSITSNNGNSVSFVVPNNVGADCQGNVACPMYARLITPGVYPVSVRSPGGTSNAVQFIVTGSSPFPTTTINWIYSATPPQGFDNQNGPNPIVGSAPYYVIFRQNPQMAYLVWTRNGTPATDGNGNMFYGTPQNITQMAAQQSVTANFEQQIASYFATSPKNYLVASLFIDGGPQYQNWTIANY